MMEFKNIDSLSITECCEFLKINRQDLPDIVERLDVTSKREGLLLQRLKTLLKEDCMFFQNCKTVSEYENYLSVWVDGVWREQAQKEIVRLNAESEELDYYNKNKDSISGCKAYLRKYPNGRFVSEVKSTQNRKIQKRKIRNISIFLIITIFIAIFCLFNYEPVSYLDFTGSGEFGKMGGETRLLYDTDATLNNVDIKQSVDWINLKDDGDGRLVITVSKNYEEQRYGTVTVMAYSSFFGQQYNCISKQIVISQESGLPTFLDVNATEILFDKYGNCKTSNNFIANTDGCELEIELGKGGLSDTIPLWFTVSKNIETDIERISGRVSVVADVNKYGERFDYITIKVGNMVKRVKVCQESGLATKFLVETTTLRMAEEGTGEGMCYPIKVETDGTWWYVDASPSWLTAYADLNDKRLEVSVAANTGQIKVGTIILKSNNGDCHKINVIQNGDPTDFASESERIRLGTSGGRKYIAISNNSNKSLSAYASESWLTCSVTGTNRISIFCNENNEYPRVGTVTVRCGGESLKISVEQRGWVDCSKCDGGYKSCYNGVWDPSTMSVVHSKTRYVYDNLFSGHWVVDKCPLCNGTGKIKCSACDGKGKVEDYY